MSSRVYLFFPPCGHNLRSALGDRLNPPICLQRRRLSAPCYAKRPDVVMYAVNSLPLLPAPSSPHCTLKVTEYDSLRQTPAAHSDERPRPYKLFCVQRCFNALTPSYFEGKIVRSHPMVWSLALCPDNASQDPVVYGAELGVVSWQTIHVLHPYSRASIASAFGIRVLRKSATLGWSQNSRRYRLMRIQHARVRVAISMDISVVWVTLPPRQADEILYLLFVDLLGYFDSHYCLALLSVEYAVEACT